MSSNHVRTVGRPRRRLGSAIRPTGLGWLWALLTVGIAANGMRLRSRLRALPRVASKDSAEHGDQSHPGRSDGYRLLLARDATIDEGSVEAAVLYARTNGLDALDMVPADLDDERTLDVIRVVDPSKYRNSRLAAGRGANTALLATEELLERAGAANSTEVDAVELARLAVEVKRHAPASTDVVIVDGLRSAPEDLANRGALLAVVYGGAAPIAVAVPFVELGAIAAGLALAPFWGAAALIAYCLQPLLAVRGSVIDRPGGEVWRAATRPATVARRSMVAARPAEGTASPPDPDAERDVYQKLLADGTEPFFETRRTSCPWCDGATVVPLVTCRDLIQHKPGTFRLDKCASCGHVFQNPRLSVKGLDFYYRDFYDGLGADVLDTAFASTDAPYRGRARMVKRVCDEPKSWLDVGAGHGHFCLIAKDEFPATRFEGLDLNDGIVDAERYGWIDKALIGMFPEVSPELAGQFDVVSMHHYLEHTREPAAELEAAARALRPGGHLLIEVPDPDCRLGSLLGRWWGPWFQPQHQQFLSIENLSKGLAEFGFSVVDVERAEAHQPVDAAFSTFLLLNHLGPLVGQPWQPAATPAGTARRAITFAAGAPLLALALLADRVMAPLLGRLPGGSNTYRLLARLDRPLTESSVGIHGHR